MEKVPQGFTVCIVHLIRVIKSRSLRWEGREARMEEDKSAFRIVTGSKPSGKKPLGRPRRGWEYNIRMDLKGIGFCAKNCVGSV